MRPRDHKLSQKLAAALIYFDQKKHSLIGIQTPAAFANFLEQLLESIHRVKYVSDIKNRKLGERSADPGDDTFDPLKAAILHEQNGNLDEAFWLVFLLTHFGKHRRAGWHYVRGVYGRLGNGSLWNWINTSINPMAFREWLHTHKDEIRLTNIPNGFGNHRKYESLDAFSPRGTGAVIESYIDWIGPTHSHQKLMEEAYQQSDGDPKTAFNYLFNSMKEVIRFGRTARFDYLSMVGNLGLATIEPGFIYLQNSTGPMQGTQLLFGQEETARIGTRALEAWLIELGGELGIGMQVLEDALCNWQKSPEIFKRFRG